MFSKLVFVFSFLLSGIVYAGSANCTSPVVNLSESPQYYYASASDCIIKYNRSSFTTVRSILPLSGVSNGDEITVVDETPFQYDQCSGGICFPATVDVQMSPSSDVSNAGEYPQGEPYRYTMKFAYDGGWSLVDFY